MQRWRGLEEIPGDWGRSVVTIGSFDGVHRGHQLIINRAVERARELGAKAVVVTFDPHPSEVVRPGSHPPLLAPQPRRAELIAELGVDAVLVLPFTFELSQESPETFVQQVLVDALHARAVIEGPNFRFGHKAAGNVELLAKLGRGADFDVEVVDLQVCGEIAAAASRSPRPSPGGWSPPGTWRAPTRCSAVRTGSRAWWCAARSAAASWGTRPPTWRPCRTARSRPTASTRAG